MTDSIHASPSGRYVLTTGSIETKPGCWSYYTLGSIKRASGEPIVEVKRNYSSFPFEWIEDHPSGHDLLVCGENYQGQTVIELDTGRRRDFLPAEAAKGHGFCWVSYYYAPEQRLVVVSGCYWACPYETRFYDFSDPMEKGWPELEFPEGMYADDCEKNPEVHANGKIVVFETRCVDDDADDEVREVIARTTFQREGNKLLFVEKWVDENEQRRRDEHKVANDKWEAEWAEYKKTDPYFLLVKERVEKDDLYRADYSVSIGQCYKGWCPHFDGTDARVCRRLAERRDVGGTQVTIDMEWGRTSAPIKVIVFRDKGQDEVSWFEHSLAGMTAALDFVRDTLQSAAGGA